MKTSTIFKHCCTQCCFLYLIPILVNFSCTLADPCTQQCYYRLNIRRYICEYALHTGHIVHYIIKCCSRYLFYNIYIYSYVVTNATPAAARKNLLITLYKRPFPKQTRRQVARLIYINVFKIGGYLYKTSLVLHIASSDHCIQKNYSHQK